MFFEGIGFFNGILFNFLIYFNIFFLLFGGGGFNGARVGIGEDFLSPLWNLSGRAGEFVFNGEEKILGYGRCEVVQMGKEGLVGYGEGQDEKANCKVKYEFGTKYNNAHKTPMVDRFCGVKSSRVYLLVLTCRKYWSRALCCKRVIFS